jgi:hypothetical protein
MAAVLGAGARPIDPIREGPARDGRPGCAPTLDGGMPEVQLLGGFTHTRTVSAEPNDPRPRHKTLRPTGLAYDGLLPDSTDQSGEPAPISAAVPTRVITPGTPPRRMRRR